MTQSLTLVGSYLQLIFNLLKCDSIVVGVRSSDQASLFEKKGVSPWPYCSDEYLPNNEI